jgi:hypothetical protein
MLTMKDVIALDSGEYGDDVTRDNGQRIRWLDLYDRDPQARIRSIRATLGPDVDPASVPSMGTPVEADVGVDVAVGKTGAGRLKWRINALRVIGEAAKPVRAAA